MRAESSYFKINTANATVNFLPTSDFGLLVLWLILVVVLVIKDKMYRNRSNHSDYDLYRLQDTGEKFVFPE